MKGRKGKGQSFAENHGEWLLLPGKSQLVYKSVFLKLFYSILLHDFWIKEWILSCDSRPRRRFGILQCPKYCIRLQKYAIIPSLKT